MTKEFDHMFKLLIIGDNGVGKSSLMTRFVGNTCSDGHITTIGVDFRIKTIEVDNERVRLQIWDTAGQERFTTLTSTYYRGSHGVIVVYDITNTKSFANVKQWLQEMDRTCNVEDLVLVGNKTDDEVGRAVLSVDAQRYADGIGIKLFETSAKENINVEEVFHSITRMALNTKKDPDNRLKNCRSRGIRISLWDSVHKSGHKKLCSLL